MNEGSATADLVLALSVIKQPVYNAFDDAPLLLDE